MSLFAAAPATPAQQIRSAMRALRRSLTAEAQLQAARQLADHAVTLPAIAQARHIAGYLAIGGEIDLHALRDRLPAARWYLPILDDDGSLRFAEWPDDNAPHRWQQNRLGIAEPVATPDQCRPAGQLDVVLTPLVAFDACGHRLGQGGGFYDRTFAFLKQHRRPAQPWLIGCAHHLQQVPALTGQAWDVDLDAIVTDTALLRPGGDHD